MAQKAVSSSGSYGLQQPLTQVKGIGPTRARELAAKGLTTIADLLLWLPLRYEDRSQTTPVAELKPGQKASLKAHLLTITNSYKGRKSWQTASFSDATGKIKARWFNLPYLAQQLVKGREYYLSGPISDQGWLMQPAVEAVSTDTIHTNRLVPMYSQVPGIAMGLLRRWQKEIVDHLAAQPDLLSEAAQAALPDQPVLPLTDSLRQLHFPEQNEQVVQARQRLALEELVLLMQRAQRLKKNWQATQAPTLGDTRTAQAFLDQLPPLPFALTGAQLRAVGEIITDLPHSHPMNRLLVGDVGSGKTAVAGLAAYYTIQQGQAAALVAPTRILAEQHAERLCQLFPTLTVQLVTGGTAPTKTTEPCLWVGTQAVINQLATHRPSLVIFDEQHRFGVNQRSAGQALQELLGWQPHTLTMSATPIPRSLMLTIFAHLSLSVLDELPAGRQPITTWVVPSSKRQASWQWLLDTLASTAGQALVVCPFIDAATTPGWEQVAAVTTYFAEFQRWLGSQTKPDGNPWRIAMLHGRQNRTEQTAVSTALYNQELDVVITTPIVEVGVDLPAANIVVIESAERFGLASLHQLRGRVGRAGQKAYCLLFSSSKAAATKTRLQRFSQTTKGHELAELDLENRGAGDLFGTEQHGFDQLQFATWTNVELIHQARQLFDYLVAQDLVWQPSLPQLGGRDTTEPAQVAAN